MSEKKRPERFVLSDDLLMDLERHAYSNLEAEVGGMLFGEIVDGKTIIAGSVAAVTAEAQQISLTFTHDVWQDILKVGEERYPGKTIVGWYHTHPSFGLFLSEYDQFIQNNFFANPGQLALVIDPIAGNMGWFEIRPNKKIEMVFQEDTNSGPREAVKAAEAEKTSSFKLAIAAGSAAILGAALGWGIAIMNVPTDQSSVVNDLQMQLQVLDGEYQNQSTLIGDTTDGKLTFWYSTRNGDTLESLAREFWGSAGTVKQITDVNPNVKTGQVLVSGTVLQIVDAQNFELENSFVTPTPTATPTPKITPSPSASSTPKK